MELLFAYDDRVVCDHAGNLYTGSTFSQSVFDRYLHFFSHITLLARPARKNTDVSRMNRIDGQKVSVIFLPDRRGSVRSLLSLSEQREFEKAVQAQITDNRSVICRLPSSAGAIAAAYCRKIGKPFLVEVVGCPWDSYRNHSLAGKVLAPFEWAIQRKAVRSAPYSLYVTREFLQRRYPCGGICAAISDVELQAADEAVLKMRLKKIERHTGVWKIGTAAAVDVAYKGQQFVIEALAMLKAQGRTDFEYHLAGGGNAAALRALAEKLGVETQVIFDGSLPHEQMFSWLDALDLYIQPSTVEAMPRALLEAMSRALPCFASEVGGIPELLGHAEIVPPKNPDAIAELLCSLSCASLVDMAAANFSKAANFERLKLEKARQNFYRAFAASYYDAANAEPIRVLHVFAALDAGGVENFVMNAYRHIDRSKIQFDFAMTSGRKGLYDKEVLSMGGRIFYFDTRKSIRQNLRELLKKYRFDAIHSHVFFYSGVVLREAKKSGIPVRIAHAHNAYTGESRRLLRRGYELLMRMLILRSATSMLGCSEKACRYVFGENCLRDARVRVLPDGIDCSRFAFDPSVREEMRRRLGLENKFVIGHIGHFLPAKNHEKILFVFSEVLKLRDDAALLLVGDGSLEQSVRERAKALGLSEKVVFAGAHTDVERYYQAMDVFLFPSRYEGFGMAMVEAQANGLSCAASDVVPKEADVTGHTAFLPLDSSDTLWANALLCTESRSNSSESLALVQRNFSSQASADKLSELYLTSSHR